jgi:hypothetical protein
MVDYQILDLKADEVSPYKETIYHEDFAVPGSDDERTELVRSEVLFTQSVPVLGEPPVWDDQRVPEIVAEFAVDLKVGVWTTAGDGKLKYLEGAAADAETAPAAGALGLAASGPTAIRSLNLRLVVRSREADRAENTDPDDWPEGFMLRAPMPNSRWARARTLMTNVTLMNHRGDAW